MNPIQIKVRLSMPQFAALECRGRDGMEDCPALLRSWQESREFILVDLADADAIITELNELSNAEDWQHQNEHCAFAGRAARTLGTLGLAVARLAHVLRKGARP